MISFLFFILNIDELSKIRDLSVYFLRFFS